MCSGKSPFAFPIRPSRPFREQARSHRYSINLEIADIPCGSGLAREGDTSMTTSAGSNPLHLAKVAASSSRKCRMNLLSWLGQWAFAPTEWLVIGLAITLAYIVFGIAGFGTALVAAPVLLLFMPLS